jgi:hypothetical protein
MTPVAARERGRATPSSDWSIKIPWISAPLGNEGLWPDVPLVPPQIDDAGEVTPLSYVARLLVDVGFATPRFSWQSLRRLLGKWPRQMIRAI